MEYFAYYHTAKLYSFMHTSVQQLLTAFYISQWKPSLQAEVFAQSFSLSLGSKTFLHRLFSDFDPQRYVHSIFQHFAGFTRLEGSEIQECVLQVIHAYKAVCNGLLIILRHNISHWRTRPFLSLVECLYNAQNESVYELVASHSEGQINLTHVSLDPYEFLSVGRLLCFFKTEETVLLVLSHASVYDEGLDYLFKEFKGQTCSLKLNLGSNNLTPRSAENIAPLLHNNIVVHLYLSYSSIFSEGAKCIAGALVSNTSLLLLDLSCCAIGDEGIHEISKALSSNQTLQEICLSDNPFTNDGLMLLSDTLERNKGLRKIMIDPHIDKRMKDVLKYNPHLSRVTGEGLKLFVGGMAENEHITELDIGEFGTEDEGVMEALKLINEDRKRRGIHVLTIFCSSYTVYGSDHLDLRF